MSEGKGGYDYLANGLSKLKGAALLMIISSLLMSVGIFAGVFMYFFATAIVPHGVAIGEVGEHMGPPYPPFGMMGMVPLAAVGVVLFFIAIIIVGFALALIAVYGRLLPAAEDFSRYSAEFSTSASLIKIGYLIGLILGIVGAVTLIFGVGILLLIVAWIFLIIGTIGLALLCFKINDKLKSGIFVVAGILFILSIIPFLRILAFIGWVLIYVESGTLIKTHLKKTT